MTPEASGIVSEMKERLSILESRGEGSSDEAKEIRIFLESEPQESGVKSVESEAVGFAYPTYKTKVTIHYIQEYRIKFFEILHKLAEVGDVSDIFRSPSPLVHWVKVTGVPNDLANLFGVKSIQWVTIEDKE